MNIEAVVMFIVPENGCYDSVVHRAVQHAAENAQDDTYLKHQSVSVRVHHSDNCVAVQARHKAIKQ